MGASIEFFEKEFINARDAYASKILDSITDEETFWEYYPKLHKALPVGRWVSDCPKFIDEWTDDVVDEYQRTETVYFDYVLENIEDYRIEPGYQEDYLSEEQREIIKNNSTWELMQEILDYTRENQICGFIWDW